jgi:hypothetical protein
LLADELARARTPLGILFVIDGVVQRELLLHFLQLVIAAGGDYRCCAGGLARTRAVRESPPVPYYSVSTCSFFSGSRPFTDGNHAHGIGQGKILGPWPHLPCTSTVSPGFNWTFPNSSFHTVAAVQSKLASSLYFVSQRRAPSLHNSPPEQHTAPERHR